VDKGGQLPGVLVPMRHSQVLWMALHASDHVLNRFVLETDLINSSEQGEPGE